MGEFKIIDLDFDPEDIHDICTFFDLPEDQVLHRLNNYRFAEMAKEWRKAEPKTPSEMLEFYSKTELYIWELIQWHTTSDYNSRLGAADYLIDYYSPLSHHRVLDYGCGVGTIALRFAQKGYSVTIADVPGKTLDFTKHRFQRRVLSYKSFEINNVNEVPDETFDIIVCIDVLEHLPNPDKILFKLSKILPAGGLAIIATTWWRDDDFPHHLEKNCQKYGDTRNWWVYLNAAGLTEINPLVYWKVGGLRKVARKFRFYLWKQTGFFLARVPRYLGDHQ